MSLEILIHRTILQLEPRHISYLALSRIIRNVKTKFFNSISNFFVTYVTTKRGINVPKKRKENKSTGVTGAIYIGIYPARTLAPCHGPYDATTNYTWARGRSRWLGPQEAGSTPLKLELRRPSARKTTRRRYEPPPTPRSRGRGGETRQGEVARERERQARENYLFPRFHILFSLLF